MKDLKNLFLRIIDSHHQANLVFQNSDHLTGLFFISHP